MRTFAIFALLIAPFASVHGANPSTDHAHKHADGPSTICGVTAPNALNFQLAVRDSGSYSLLNQNDDYFAIMSKDETTIWAFTMPESTKPTSAICTRLVRSQNGSISGEFDMRCDGDRIDCDGVYREWLDYHQRVTLNRVKATPKELGSTN